MIYYSTEILYESIMELTRNWLFKYSDRKEKVLNSTNFRQLLQNQEDYLRMATTHTDP